ncbi:MAG: hypothetical protein ACKPER_01910 [Dolichospermum sp.]
MGLVIYFNVYEKNLNRISSLNKTLQIFQQTQFRIYIGVTKNYHVLSLVKPLVLMLFTGLFGIISDIFNGHDARTTRVS